MMKLEDIQPGQLDYSDEQLKYAGEVLLKADEIKADKQLLTLVEDAMKKKVTAIKSLGDMRRKAVMLETEAAKTGE
jgi:hypothetical protein